VDTGPGVPLWVSRREGPVGNSEERIWASGGKHAEDTDWWRAVWVRALRGEEEEEEARTETAMLESG